jgi:hypothetical protein
MFNFDLKSRMGMSMVSRTMPRNSPLRKPSLEHRKPMISRFQSINQPKIRRKDSIRVLKKEEIFSSSPASGKSGKPRVKSGIKIVIHGVKKERETIVRDTVGVITVGTLELYGFKHKSVDKLRAESEYFWVNGKKFKDNSLANGLEFDCYKLLTVGKFTIKRNIDFLKKLVDKNKNLAGNSIYHILKMGDQDALIAKLISKTYMLMNVEDITFDIPHNFGEYMVFFKTIQKAVTEGLKLNKEKTQELNGRLTKLSSFAQGNDVSDNGDDTIFKDPVDIVKHFKQKLFITLQNFNVEI